MGCGHDGVGDGGQGTSRSKSRLRPAPPRPAPPRPAPTRPTQPNPTRPALPRSAPPRPSGSCLGYTKTRHATAAAHDSATHRPAHTHSRAHPVPLHGGGVDGPGLVGVAGLARAGEGRRVGRVLAPGGGRARLDGVSREVRPVGKRGQVKGERKVTGGSMKARISCKWRHGARTGGVAKMVHRSITR